MHQRLEMEDDGKLRYCELWLADKRVSIRRGGKGIRAKDEVAVAKNKAEAKVDYLRRVAELVAAGWRETLDELGRPIPKITRSQDLEAAILSAPDACDAYAVYGDWLSEQGDPLGELVAVQIAREAAPDNAALEKREAALMRAHDRVWLGDLWGADRDLEPPHVTLSWRWGFLHTVSIRSWSARLYPALLEAPAGAFVREVGIVVVAGLNGRRGDESGIVALTQQPLPRSLRALSITIEGSEWSFDGVLDRLAAFVKRGLPAHLESVRVGGALTVDREKALKEAFGARLVGPLKFTADVEGFELTFAR